MLRSILSVIVGYFVMAIVVMLAFSVVIVAPDFAFRSGGRNVTTAWIAYTAAASFAAAVLGGWVAARIARSHGVGVPLAGVVLVLGVLSAFGNAAKRNQSVPAYDPVETTLQCVTYAVQPTAYAFAMPIVGAAGVLLGAYLAGASRNAAAQPV